MQLVLMTGSDRDALFARLAAMPGFLRQAFRGLSEARARERGPRGGFAPVEQCWHLADLEREGWGERIRRLLAEESPELPDFDGDRIARERRYLELALDVGLARFAAARRANLELLRTVAPDQWQRGGIQQGFGPVTLCDLPSMMAAHDAAHRAEIEAWSRHAP